MFFFFTRLFIDFLVGPIVKRRGGFCYYYRTAVGRVGWSRLRWCRTLYPGIEKDNNKIFIKRNKRRIRWKLLNLHITHVPAISLPVATRFIPPPFVQECNHIYSFLFFKISPQQRSWYSSLCSAYIQLPTRAPGDQWGVVNETTTGRDDMQQRLYMLAVIGNTAVCVWVLTRLNQRVCICNNKDLHFFSFSFYIYLFLLLLNWSTVHRKKKINVFAAEPTPIYRPVTTISHLYNILLNLNNNQLAGDGILMRFLLLLLFLLLAGGIFIIQVHLFLWREMLNNHFVDLWYRYYYYKIVSRVASEFHSPRRMT